MTVSENAKRARKSLLGLSSVQKNALLLSIASAVEQRSAEIVNANNADIAACKKDAAFIDRLVFSAERIKSAADGLKKLAKLDDPVGAVLEEKTLYNGLRLKKIAVPIGVVAVIYEARPNVTVDAAGILLKTSNVALLRGSTDAVNTNRAIVRIIRDCLTAFGVDGNAVSLAECDHDGVKSLLSDTNNIDLAIPRGSKGLIDFVRREAVVPVIETGAGNCSAYIDDTCDIDTAVDVVLNAKTQRISVCNALESLYIKSNALERSVPILSALCDAGVTVHGDKYVCKAFPRAVLATEDDYYREYLSMDISVKTVEDVADAVECVNKYGTHHSDVILSADSASIDYFEKYVDSACVYANASTRFTDGGEFGLGAEIGISTQKLHARGPMGLKELVSYKYVIDGEGQIRR